MTTTKSPEYLRQNESRFSLNVGLVLLVALSTNMVGEIEDLSPNITRIAWLCFMLQIILIQMGNFILQYHVQIPCAQLIKFTSLLIKSGTCHFFPELYFYFGKLLVKCLCCFWVQIHIWKKIFILFIVKRQTFTMSWKCQSSLVLTLHSLL